MPQALNPGSYMSQNLNALNGDYVGDYMGGTIGVIEGDTRSLATQVAM